MNKTDVRSIALQHDLPAKQERQHGICFIGERKFRPFLQKYVHSKPGFFQRLDGSIVGKHHGACYYTIGQRKQLGLGGPGERWYVVKKDHEANIVYVERGEHPQLFCTSLTVSDVSWIEKHPELPLRCKAKIRYRQEDQDCVVTRQTEKQLLIDFDQPQRAAAPGQTVAFYDGDQCLGCGTIDSLGQSEWEKQNGRRQA